MLGLRLPENRVPHYNSPMPPGFITTVRAAEILGVSRGRVVALIRAKRLPAERFGRVWMIKEEDLELVKDRKPGREGWQKR